MNLRPLPPQLAIYTRYIYENRMLFLIIFGCLPLLCLDFELSSALNYVRGIWLEVNGFSRLGANFQTVRTGFLHQKNRAPSSFCLSGTYYIIFSLSVNRFGECFLIPWENSSLLQCPDACIDQVAQCLLIVPRQERILTEGEIGIFHGYDFIQHFLGGFTIQTAIFG